MRFSRVQSRKVSAIAAEQIVDAIHRGDFPVGSRLPSEFDLAEQDAMWDEAKRAELDPE